MSSSIPIYIVPENALRRAAGSKDAALFEQLVRADTLALRTTPETTTTSELLMALIGQPPLRRALKKLIYGPDHKSPSSGFYLTAYEMFCTTLAFEHYEHWIQVSRSMSWLDEVHSAAAGIGVHLDYNQLIFGGSLVQLPDIYHDGISFGFWSAETVRHNKVQVDGYLSSSLCETKDDPMRALNYPLHDTSEWLNRAASHEDGAIVAFHLL